jgi:hypothetical protein
MKDDHTWRLRMAHTALLEYQRRLEAPSEEIARVVLAVENCQGDPEGFQTFTDRSRAWC